MRRVALAAGGAVWAPTERDVRLVEQEVADAGRFALGPGDVVLDVGANVGLYSIGLAWRHGRLRFVLVEPNPAAYAALIRNAAEHLGGCAVALVDCAVGDASGWAELTVDPTLTVAGSTTPEAFAGAAWLDAPGRDWVIATVRDMARIGELSPRAARLVLAALATPGLAQLAVGIAASLNALDRLDRRRRVRRVRRPVRTIGELIAEHGLARVDLLKLDVEGAELAALNGIGPADWPRIRQLLVEVHDVDGRIAAVEAMLRARGYAVRRLASPWALHELLGIATLEAVRG